ncbi:hypothetical protein G7046_g786 [Stylonectria norvegica]|nr:hypothetical protein G7046_g786 [Stylonectria norvegica]
MPRRNKTPDLDFEIHVDPSCLSEPMDDKDTKGRQDPNDQAEAEQLPQTEAEPQMENHKHDDGATIDPNGDEHLPEAEPDESRDSLASSTYEGESRDLFEEHHMAAESSEDVDSTTPTQNSTEETIAAGHGEDPNELHNDHISTTYDNEDQDEKHHTTDIATEASDSRRESAISSSSTDSERRTSGRTEALIHAAARDIVAQIGQGKDRDSLQSDTGSEGHSYISNSEPASARPSDAHLSVADESHLSNEDDENAAIDEADNHSSHHENEDDVFSDNSPRSSMGSVSEGDPRKPEDLLSQMRSPRVSDMSQYDRDYENVEQDFVPTVRGTPRPAFRSPSSVKAMQMSSPPPSVLGSPRASRRGLPTISRLGSPSVSAQYSPKKTPPRFKRNTPPLVLLHVTLLPLRWGWGDVLDHAKKGDLSQDCKVLRDAWRMLQDRMGDTTVERGILLPHPQNDYEVLEERLLEALELPMRRRARILECGHYLGPSNEMTLAENSDSEEDDYDDEDRRSTRQSMERKLHWCKTCGSDIRYDSLGPGKIFRVKIYASNGLIKAGAWEACWKEMERVDVELEPIVEPAVEDELGHIEAEQLRVFEEWEDKKKELEEKERAYTELKREEDRVLAEKRREQDQEFADRRREIEEETRAIEDERRALELRMAQEDEEFGDTDDEFEEHLENHEELHEELQRGFQDEHVDDHDGSRLESRPANHYRAYVEDDYDDENADHAKGDTENPRSVLEQDLAEDRESSQDQSPKYGKHPDEDLDASYLDRDVLETHAEPSSTQPESQKDLSPGYEERQRRDEERLREIYGHRPSTEEHQQPEQHYEPQTHQEQQDRSAYSEPHDSMSSQPQASDYPQSYTPQSPSVGAFERREGRRQAYKSASLPELLLESVKVLMQDKKNIMIGLLSILILMLALRSSQPEHDPRTFQTLVQSHEVPTVTVTQAPAAETVESVDDVVALAATMKNVEVVVESQMPSDGSLHHIEENEKPFLEVEAHAYSVESLEPYEERQLPSQESNTASVMDIRPSSSEVRAAVQQNHSKVQDRQTKSKDSPTPTPAADSTDSVDPCASCTLSSGTHSHSSAQAKASAEVGIAPVLREPETVFSKEIVRIFETVTEVVKVKVTATETETIHPKVTQHAKAIEENSVAKSQSPTDRVAAALFEEPISAAFSAPASEWYANVFSQPTSKASLFTTDLES